MHADLCSPLAFDERVDAIVHCVGAAPATGRQVSELIAENLDSTRQVVEYALRCRPRLYLFFSTMSVYGSVSVSRVSEDTPVVNPPAYGMARLLSEQNLEVHADRVPTIAAILGPGASNY